MTTKPKTVCYLTESAAYEDTTALDIFADKIDALFDVHEEQTGYCEDYDITYWSNDNGSESIGLDDHTWTVAPAEFSR